MHLGLKYKAIYLVTALTIFAAAASGAARGAETHTFSGTVTVPVYVPADSLPYFTLELDGQTVSSRNVVGGGVLALTFAGSATEPTAQRKSCPGRGSGARLGLTGLSAGSVVSATYTPDVGTPTSTQLHVVQKQLSRVTAAACTR